MTDRWTAGKDKTLHDGMGLVYVQHRAGKKLSARTIHYDIIGTRHRDNETDNGCITEKKMK